MGKVIKGLFGGDGGAQKKAEQARRESEQRQRIASDAQAAQLNREDSKTLIDSRPRRGRRLFASVASGSDQSRPAKKTLS